MLTEGLVSWRGQALITASNHVAALDVPLVTAALLPPRRVAVTNRPALDAS